MLFSKKLKEKDKEIDSLTNLANKLIKERTVINIRGNCKSDWLINEIYKKLNDGETIAIINKNGERNYIRKCGSSH